MNKGFTLLELLVVIGVIAMIAALSMPSFRAIRENIAVQNEAYEIVNNLRIAQNLALVSQGGKSHGVHFYADSYVLYAGDWSSPEDVRIYATRPGISIFDGAGSEVVFSRLTGVSAPASISVGTDAAGARAIAVDKSGRVNLEN